VIDGDVQGLGDIAKLCQKMRKVCLQRQRQTNVAKKAKWSLFSREKFIELVDNIQKLVDDLENVFPAEARVSKEADLCEQEASELRDEKALPELQKIALVQDALLAEAIAKLVRNVRASSIQIARRRS
jgi:signal recognition particle GTPase